MFTSHVPSFTINLQLDEARRWTDVIVKERDSASRIVQEAAAQFERVPEILRRVFARLFERSGGYYRGEIKSWADATGASVGTVTMLNCAYELSHLHFPKIFGCTAGVRWVDGLGMTHVRTLDWPLATMGEATRLFRFRRGDREFVSIGVPGQVGVLSGMVPGGYSVTINWAPPAANPTFDFGPTFLLRDTLENCDKYDAAVEILSKTPLSASVFFTVCGIERNQACVIERSQRENAVRPFVEPVLVQANHHIASKFVKNNEAIREVPPGEEVFSIDGSTRRVNVMTQELSKVIGPTNLENAVAPLNVPTVLNNDTCQQMVFCPASGEISVWRKVI